MKFPTPVTSGFCAMPLAATTSASAHLQVIAGFYQLRVWRGVPPAQPALGIAPIRLTSGWSRATVAVSLSIWQRRRMAQSDQRFEQLKQKYQPVQNAMAQNQVRLQNLNMQGDKLFMRAEAPSEDAKNRVWDQIKTVDPSYSDLIADITVVA